MRYTRGRKLGALVLILALIITQTACSSKSELNPVSKENYFLDTICRLSIYEINDGLDEEEAMAAIDAGYDRCRELDKMLSNKNEKSEVSKINNAGGEWVEVSDDVIEVIKCGLHYSELSGGEFDITIGRVTDLWDFHADDPVVPDKAALEEAVKHVDYRKVEIDGNRVRLLDPEMKLDLGGIAKGYICDQITDVLADKGVTSAVIDLGGNIVTLGKKPDDTEFVIGIEKPYSDRSEIIGKTKGTNETFVTSGVYEREFEADGKVYHHVLNAKTGYPVDTDLDSVTIVANRDMSMNCDAISTICLIKGLKGGMQFAKEQEGIEAVFCPSNGDIEMTEGMDFEGV